MTTLTGFEPWRRDAQHWNCDILCIPCQVETRAFVSSDQKLHSFTSSSFVVKDLPIIGNTRATWQGVQCPDGMEVFAFMGTYFEQKAQERANDPILSLRQYFSWLDEKRDFHPLIKAGLQELGYEVKTEVYIKKNRIDFTAQKDGATILIEAKLKPANNAFMIMAQIELYRRFSGNDNVAIAIPLWEQNSDLLQRYRDAGIGIILVDGDWLSLARNHEHRQIPSAPLIWEYEEPTFEQRLHYTTEYAFALSLWAVLWGVTRWNAITEGIQVLHSYYGVSKEEAIELMDGSYSFVSRVRADCLNDQEWATILAGHKPYPHPLSFLTQLREMAINSDMDFLSGAAVDEQGRALLTRNVRLLK